MKVNFDILIAGCNTRCRHCYVNGGPGGLMPLETALLTFIKGRLHSRHAPGAAP